MSNIKKNVAALYTKTDKSCPTISQFGRNLNQLWLSGKLDPCLYRDDLLLTIQKNLLRKNKPNVLLTGVAGCGKTAVAEGLAAILTQRRLDHTRLCEAALKEHKQLLDRWSDAGGIDDSPEYVAPPAPPLYDCVVYDLSINAMVGGTKYRGDFEERLENVIRECRTNPNIILFIDEFHCILSAGACNENLTGAAQMLKPALARGDIRVIGATTTEEKGRLLNDKAFARRFTELEVPVLQGDTALNTARSILKYYCAHHTVPTDILADEILEQLQFHLPDTVFPDNFINVVDETLAGAVFDGENTVSRTAFYKTLSRLTGRIIIDPDALSKAG